MRRVLEGRPPEEEPGQVARVLEVEQRLRMAQRRVVGGREVPGEIRREPERKPEGGMGEHADSRRRSRRGGEPGGTPRTSSAGAHSARTTF